MLGGHRGVAALDIETTSTALVLIASRQFDVAAQ
jgi:hypothetical protein